MAIPVDNTVRDSVSPLTSEPPVPRVSGFVPHSSEASRSSNGASKPVGPLGHPAPATLWSVADVIRGANAELEQRAAQQLTISLTLALQQRDHFIAEVARERELWQRELGRQTALFAEQLRERETTLEQLRRQVQEAERELLHLREEPKTTIGIGPRASHVFGSKDSGEHASLQSALETAWQDVEDARSRLAALEVERDDALKNADELRVELYDKLAQARDEAIETETRLSEAQRAFDEAREAWEAERSRLQSEAEEARRALLVQLQVNRPALDADSGAAFAAGDSFDQPGRLASPLDDEVVPLVQAAPQPLELQTTAFISPPTSQYTGSQVPPAAPAPPESGFPSGFPSAPPRSLSDLLGFEPSVIDNSEEALAAAAQAGDERKRSKGFGLGRLFRTR